MCFNIYGFRDELWRKKLFYQVNGFKDTPKLICSQFLPKYCFKF